MLWKQNESKLGFGSKIKVNYAWKINESKLFLELKNLKLIGKNLFFTSCSIIVRKCVLQLTSEILWQEWISLC